MVPVESTYDGISYNSLRNPKKFRTCEPKMATFVKNFICVWSSEIYKIAQNFEDN